MPFRQDDVDDLLSKTGRRCCLCGGLHKVQVHHIISREEGGSDEIENAIPLCPNCHDEVHKGYSSGSVSRPYTSNELKLHRARAIDLARHGFHVASRRDIPEATLREAHTGILATYEQFPTYRIAQELDVAQERFLVWHTWTDYFHLHLQLSLRRFLRLAWDRLDQCRCRILLAHPETCACARFRARALAGAKLKSLVYKTASDLDRAIRSIGGDFPDELVEVRLYASAPSMPLYIVDRRAFVGWYPDGERSHFSPYLEINAERGELISKLETSFVKTWKAAEWKWDFKLGQPIVITPLSGGSRGVPVV